MTNDADSTGGGDEPMGSVAATPTPTPSTERAVRITACDSDHVSGVAQMIAGQIGTEQGLIATRMSWNLTYQGFTIAGFALMATASAASPARIIVQVLIACTSLIIALSTLIGVFAAQRQLGYLKSFWKKNDLSDHFPEPFSDGRGSSWGRWPARSICIALATMWVALIPFSFIWPDDEHATRISIDGDGIVMKRE